MTQKPKNLINDITVALQISFNRMQEIRKTARVLLQTESGDIRNEVKIRQASKKVCQEPGRRLHAWQEDRKQGDSIILHHLNIYLKFVR